MFPEYRAGAERGNRFALDGQNSLVSFILGRSDRETFWAQFGNTKMNRNETFGYFKVVREKFWAHFGHSRM